MDIAQVVCSTRQHYAKVVKTQSYMPRLRGFRYPREFILSDLAKSDRRLSPLSRPPASKNAALRVGRLVWGGYTAAFT